MASVMCQACVSLCVSLCVCVFVLLPGNVAPYSAKVMALFSMQCKHRWKP